MNFTICSATVRDAELMAEIRRAAILTLATAGMSSEEANRWAEASGTSAIEKRLEKVKAWIAKLDSGVTVGWVSSHENSVDGLYTLPEYAGRGIGTRMLEFIESVITTSDAKNRVES